MRKIILPFQAYFITTNITCRAWTFVNRHSRKPKARQCDIAIKNLDFYRRKFCFALHGYVIMPDHVHLVLTVGQSGTITEILRDWKHRTSFEVNHLSGYRGRVWQKDFWEHSIRNAMDFRRIVNYIHMNPVRAGFVVTPQDWLYSSASWYVNGGGPIRIDPTA